MEDQFNRLYSCKQCGYLVSELEVKSLKMDLTCPRCGCQLFAPKPMLKKPKQ